MLFSTIIFSVAALLSPSAAAGVSSDPPTSSTSLTNTLPTASPSLINNTVASGAGNLTRGFQVASPPLANTSGVVSNGTNIQAGGTASGNAVGGVHNFTVTPPIQTGDCVPSAGYPTKIIVFALLGFLGAFAFA